ncbi:hypothetical protein PFLUV_G00127720 [Perca fluviatilis]|uniref:RING-type domain-containing protein n=1 Tax=Perca fluviatilis TaxID=8168 RepID=A0A6A5F7K5_PERFL|nr:hypothetical protein PFLUV_G00127720 [Perca fluviatilis]
MINSAYSFRYRREEKKKKEAGGEEARRRLVSVSDMSSSVQRKRRSTGSPRVSSTKTSRANASRTTSRTASRAASRAACVSGTSDADPTHVMDHPEDSVEEVVDLTCEGSEAAAVVDLTNNDSVLLVDEGPQRVSAAESYVVSSDEDEAMPPRLNAAMMSSAQTNGSSRSTPGTISCPVCLDSYSEIVESGRLVVSTRCGHVFCSVCVSESFHPPPIPPPTYITLTPRQYHPLYV